MRSWKTTLGGSLAGLGTFLWGVPVTLNVIGTTLDPMVQKICLIVGLIASAAGVFFTGLFGRDNNVPSSAVPAAAAKAEEIKRDTQFHLKS